MGPREGLPPAHVHMDLPLRQAGSVTHFLGNISKGRREIPSSFLLLGMFIFRTYFIVSAAHLFFVVSKRRQEPHVYLLNEELLKEQN